MAVVIHRVVFDGGVPPIGRVIARVRELTGLALSTRESPDSLESAKVFHVQLAFACAPSTEVLAYAYDRAALEAFVNRMGAQVAAAIGPILEGMDEARGTQTLYLRIYLGQDPTLLLATAYALEQMGGRPHPALTPNEREDCGRTLTEGEVTRRCRHARWRSAAGMAVAGPVAILSIPFVLLGTLITLPWKIWQTHQNAKRAGSEDT